MTQTAIDLAELRHTVVGTIHAPGDAAYDEARIVWNGAIDRRPAAIVQVANNDDVRAAIAFARANGLELTVRGGSHNPAGTSIADGAVMIDLRNLATVTVDPEARRARVGGGATLAMLDAATQEHGLAIPAGMVSHTGVGGLTLGGGMGWLTRKAGLSIDNLVSAQVVTADGRVLRASADEHPDLFWGIRGGGGNFGVVTEFEFALHHAGPIVHFAMLFFGLDQLGDVLRVAREDIPGLPADVNVVVGALNAPPEPFVPAEFHFRPGAALMVTGFGSPDQHAAALEQFRARLTPLFEMVAPIPYVALQQMIDAPNAFGVHAYEKGTRIPELTDDVVAVYVEHVARKQSPLSLALLYRLDNAFSAVGDADTAYGGPRAPHWQAFVVGVSPVPEGLAAERDWVRGFWDGLQPHVGAGGSYVNGIADYDAEMVAKAYGSKLERLAQVKATYDPDNVFHHNANIKPAAA